jgi:hypothetical protein
MHYRSATRIPAYAWPREKNRCCPRKCASFLPFRCQRVHTDDGRRATGAVPEENEPDASQLTFRLGATTTNRAGFCNERALQQNAVSFVETIVVLLTNIE